MANVVLELFICGGNPKHVQWADQLRQACALIDPGQCTLEIVDVLRDPRRAEAAEVLATPVLIKSLPLPAQRLVGDFSSLDRLFSRLGLPSPVARAEHGCCEGVSHGACVDPCGG